MQSLARYLQKLPGQTRAVSETCLYGLAAGAATVAFQLGMNWLYRLGLVQLSRQSMTTFLIGSFAVIVTSSLLVGWLLNSFCREAAGSGIPQLKLAFWKEFGTVPWRVAWVKFVAGILSIGGGSSMGREGPSVQLAGAVASNLAGLGGEAKQNRRAAAAAGAAAGLAAAFNTPLAAATFVLEEIIGDLNSRFLGGVVLAAVLGALVVHGVIGKQPSFALRGVEDPTWLGYALTPVVAGLASIVGVYFQRASLGLRRRMKDSAVPGWLIPVFGAVTTWVLGVAVFAETRRLGVFSLGYDDLSSALAGDVGWQLAALLLGAKFIATFTSYGFGGCGGIFSPTLFFGGMTGVIVAGLVNLQWPVAQADTVTLAVVGMSACLGAVVWAPVTGILIVFEMTHQFSLVPVLMIAALVSQAVSRKMNRENFYDALLTQDGHQLEHVRPPRGLQGWQQLPVSGIANFRPVVLSHLEPAEIQKTLKAHPYQRFPVTREGKLAGILTRKEAQAALAEKRSPRLESATTCLPSRTIRQLQVLLIESTTQLVVLTTPDGQTVLGVVTLHDLLRAEVEMARASEE
ncbi:MAG: chloride channel protein [Limisphaerales bacterium]